MRHYLFKFFIITTLVLWNASHITSQVTSGASGTLQESKKPYCHKPEKLKGLCTLITGRNLDPNPIGFFKYLYQRRILEAACATDVTDEVKQAELVQRMFATEIESLTCTNGQFDVIDGNIIKYAISAKFDEFLDDMILWKVNLNTVDKADKRTVLDYVKYSMKRNEGNALENKLQSYHQQLRDAGAKYASELK